MSKMTDPEEEKYWETLQDAAKIDDYMWWGIGGLIMLPVMIYLVPKGLNVSWDDSSGRLAAILLVWTIVSSIITTIIASYNCVLWGSSSKHGGQCCRVGNNAKPNKPVFKVVESGCEDGEEDTGERDIRISKLLIYILPIIFSGMLFASMIISVNKGANSGNSFLTFFIPVMGILISQIQSLYLRIQKEPKLINSKSDTGGADGAIMTRYSAYSITLIWLLTIFIMFFQTVFGGKMMPSWASGYKIVAWIIFTILYIFFSLLETTVANVGGQLSHIINPIVNFFRSSGDS